MRGATRADSRLRCLTLIAQSNRHTARSKRYPSEID
jgi:hypothetical protein